MTETFDRSRPSKAILVDNDTERKLIIKDKQIDDTEPLSPDEIEARLRAEEEMQEWKRRQGIKNKGTIGSKIEE